ncbi:hypothetical protein M0804_007467 [Polistes exclamans]|nr:hypothetical protein M0804_007467 [Polistes exclamans]
MKKRKKQKKNKKTRISSFYFGTTKFLEYVGLILWNFCFRIPTDSTSVLSDVHVRDEAAIDYESTQANDTFFIKLIIAHIKFDYELLMNEKELNIMEKYTNQSKLYSSFLTGYWTIIQHICGQFNIFIEKVRRPFENNQMHVRNAWCCRTPQQEREWLIDIIKCYNRVTELV